MTNNTAASSEHSATTTPYPKSAYWLALLGLVLIVAGAALASMIRTSGGISVKDIRFSAEDGTTMSALLYVPENASNASPAPGILAVHGYINSRETQDGFAIEFARRGYVVLSLDQTGHGYSDGPAFSKGFGGPDGLRYLRSLPMVDNTQIGLEGHSMGGWTVLAAAAAMPDAYQSIVLQGSSTGAPFAQEGTPQWPRNMSLVFSKYDEFSKLMWGENRAIDTPQSTKLQSVFGSDREIVAGKTYGSIVDGTARVLHQPNTTHPGNHISRDSIGHATDWFAATLKGGTPLPANNQIWYWKEIGTGLGLIGFVMLILGAFDALIRVPLFSTIQQSPSMPNHRRDKRWWRRFCLSSALPAIVFFPAFIAAGLGLPANSLLPQSVTTQVTIWALACAGITLLLNRLTGEKISTPPTQWLRSILLATLTVALAYLALIFVDQVFQTDLRFWVVAIKLPSMRHLEIAAVYLIPITAAFMVTLAPLCNTFMINADRKAKRYALAIALLAGGFALLLAIIYGTFFASGVLITSLDPLSTVIALQFVPLLTAIAIISVFCWQRTASHRQAALMVGLLVTLYVVAGTATQV